MYGAPQSRAGLGFRRQEHVSKDSHDERREPPSSSSGSLSAVKAILGSAASAHVKSARSSSKASDHRHKMAALLNKAVEDSHASKGRSGGWERREAHGLSAKFREDEHDTQGGLADSALVIGTRAATLARINDESVETIFGEPTKNDEDAAKASSSELAKKARLNQSDVSHFDAMFSSSSSSSPSSSSSVKSGELVIPVAPPVPDTAELLRRKYDREYRGEPSSPPVPIWKRLVLGQSVEARFSEDGCWYPAEIRQVTHGGYPNATYTVRFTSYGNEESRSWKDINLLPGDEQACLPFAKRARLGDGAEGCARDQEIQDDAIAPPQAQPTRATINPAVVARASDLKAKSSWRAKARGRL